MSGEGKGNLLPNTEEEFMETCGSSCVPVGQIFENFCFRLRLVMGPGDPEIDPAEKLPQKT